MIARDRIDAHVVDSHVLEAEPDVLDGRYRLDAVLGAGGTATVYRALDLRLGRPVAVKVLDDAAARANSPGGRDRFLEEARSASQLQHPHLVSVYDAGTDGERLFIVMELVDGPNLAGVIADRGPLTPAEAIDIAAQVLDGLAAMHAAGLIHRDVKPANVLLDRNGRVRLADFGIAKRFDDIEQSLTVAGTVVGTPSYLAPEQATAGRLGPHTDVYLTGLLLFEMLTGDRPPEMPETAASQPLNPSTVRSELPDALAGVVTRATDPDPNRRFDTAAAMRAALAGVPPTATPRQATMVMPAGVMAAMVDPEGPTAVLAAPVPGTVVARVDAGRPRRRRWLTWALVVGGVLAALILLSIAAGADELPSDSTVPPASTLAPVVPVISSPPPPPSTPDPTSAPEPSGQPAGKGDGKKNDKRDGKGNDKGNG